MSDRLHRLWPSAAAFAALLLVYMGERLLSGFDTRRMACAVFAAGAIIAALVMRMREQGAADAHKKPVARALFGATVMVALGLAAYALIVLAFKSDTPFDTRMRGVLWGLAPILVTCGLAPIAAIELAVLGVANNPRYELRRVFRAYNRGLGLALLLSALFLANYVARKIDSKVDLAQSSKTEPSGSTRQIVASLSKPVQVVAFFPRANEVADVLGDYFKALGPAANFEVRTEDHALAAALAAEVNATENGVVIVSQGKTHEKIRVGDKIKNAKSALKTFDQSLAKAIVKVTRQSSIAYFTVGHHERRWDSKKDDERPRIDLLKQQLVANDYEVKILGVAEGLGAEVPQDAGVVFIVGPEKPFQPEEIAALVRYVNRGGRMVVALEAEREGDPMKGLLDTLGLTFDKAILANDRAYVKATMTDADKAFIYTNRFSSHESVSTMGQYSDKLAVIFPRSGSLTKNAELPPNTKVELTVTALDGTFNDPNGNYTFDAETEKRQPYALVAAVTRTASTSDGRVVVIADGDVFTDKFIRFQGNPYLFADSIVWLRDVKDPVLSTVTEEDVRIVHKRDEDALWFYSSTVGVPALLALAGVMVGQRRRKK